MNAVSRKKIEEALVELSSLGDQLRLWNSTGSPESPEISSFTEALESLFTDSGLSDPLDAGETGFGKECERRLIELDRALMKINTHQSPDTLIASPEMERVRKLAGEALAALRAGGP